MHGLTILDIEWRYEEGAAIIRFHINEPGVWDYDPGNCGWRFIEEEWEGLVPIVGHKDHTPTPITGPTFAKYVWNIKGIPGLAEDSVYGIDVQLAMWTNCPVGPKRIWEGTGSLSGQKTKGAPLIPPYWPQPRPPLKPPPDEGPPFGAVPTGDAPIFEGPGGGGGGGPTGTPLDPIPPYIPPMPTGIAPPYSGTPPTQIPPAPIGPEAPPSTQTPIQPISPGKPKKVPTKSPDPIWSGQAPTGVANPDPQGPTTKKVGPVRLPRVKTHPTGNRPIDDMLPGTGPKKIRENPGVPTKTFGPDDISYVETPDDVADPLEDTLISRTTYPMPPGPDRRTHGVTSIPVDSLSPYLGVSPKGQLRDISTPDELPGAAGVFEASYFLGGMGGMFELDWEHDWYASTVGSGEFTSSLSVLPNPLPYGQPANLAAAVHYDGTGLRQIDVVVGMGSSVPQILASGTQEVTGGSTVFWRGNYAVTPPPGGSGIYWFLAARDSQSHEILTTAGLFVPIQSPEVQDPVVAAPQAGTSGKPSVYLDPVVDALYGSFTGTMTSLPIKASSGSCAHVILTGEGPLDLLVAPEYGKRADAHVTIKVAEDSAVSTFTGALTGYTGTTIADVDTVLTYKGVPVVSTAQYAGATGIDASGVLHIFVESQVTVPLQLFYNDAYQLVPSTGDYDGVSLTGKVGFGNAQIYVLEETLSGEASTGAYQAFYTNSKGEFSEALTISGYYKLYREDYYGAPYLSGALYTGEA